MYTPEIIQQILVANLPGAEVKVTGMNDHFEAVVIWNQFEGKSLVEQHQIVMAPLQEGLKEAIHALGIKTFTPEKWSKRRQQL